MAYTEIPPMVVPVDTKIVVVTAENNTKDPASANNVALITGEASNGGLVTEIGYKAAGTTVASTLLIFLSEETGATFYLFDEIIIPAITSTVAVKSASGSVRYTDLILADGQKIKVGVAENTGGTNIHVYCKHGKY